MPDESIGRGHSPLARSSFLFAAYARHPFTIRVQFSLVNENSARVHPVVTVTPRIPFWVKPRMGRMVAHVWSAIEPFVRLILRHDS
jgi:hypothetical protein